jgi:acyl carrier protein
MKYLAEVKIIIAKILNLPESSLDVDTDMSEISEWDSMSNIRILSTLEEHYNILFPEDDVFDLTSVSALAEEIEKIKG